MIPLGPFKQQMNAIHALGYSMLISGEDPTGVMTTWRKYHQNVRIILWEDALNSHLCLEDPTCVFSDPTVEPPPPNVTHANIPTW